MLLDPGLLLQAPGSGNLLSSHIYIERKRERERVSERESVCELAMIRIWRPLGVFWIPLGALLPPLGALGLPLGCLLAAFGVAWVRSGCFGFAHTSAAEFVIPVSWKLLFFQKQESQIPLQIGPRKQNLPFCLKRRFFVAFGCQFRCLWRAKEPEVDQQSSLE